MKKDAKVLLQGALEDLALIHELLDGVIVRLRQLQELRLSEHMNARELNEYRELKEIVRTLEMVA